ncbi:hypothetical protein KR009_007717, partial [Drosophila setifemur]
KFYSADMSNLMVVPRVKIASGHMRYLLLLVYNHGHTGLGRTIVRGSDVDHLDLFEQVLEEMDALGICAKSQGGGFLDNDSGNQKIRIYGKCRNFGEADHNRTRNILQSWDAYKNFKFTI